MAAPSSAPPGSTPPLPPDRAAGSTRAKTQLGLDPDTAALIFPSPHEVGRRCPGGADEGLFSGKRDGSRGDASSSCKARYASQSPPHPPLRGTFSPSKAGEKGKWGVLG